MVRPCCRLPMKPAAWADAVVEIRSDRFLAKVTRSIRRRDIPGHRLALRRCGIHVVILLFSAGNDSKQFEELTTCNPGGSEFPEAADRVRSFGRDIL